MEYPLGGSSKKGSHVYVLLIVAMVLLLWRQIVLLWPQITMVESDQHLYQTIVLPRKLATGSIHDYLFCYCSQVGILFTVLRIGLIKLAHVLNGYRSQFNKLSDCQNARIQELAVHLYFGLFWSRCILAVC